MGVELLRHICRIVGHKRCKRQARPFAGSWRSKCRLCGAPLVRLRQRRWVTLSEVHDHASASLGPAFDRAWPVNQTPSFTDLLSELDNAEGKKPS